MSNTHSESAYAVHFTRLEPLQDAQHGKPCTRSSHGLSLLTLGEGGRDSSSSEVLVLIGGEHVARTPLSFDEFLWVAEQVVAGDGDEDKKTEKSMAKSWKWRSMRNPKGSTGTLPPLRVAHAQAAVGESVYMFGGRSGIDMGENAMNDLWQFHIPSETWTRIESQESDHVPEARSFHRMIAIDKTLFIFGGCGASGRLKDLHSFDLTTKKWTDHGSSSLLAGRGGPNVLPFSDLKTQQPYIAIVAGFKGEESNDGHICRSNKSEWEWDKELMGSLETLRPRSVCVSGVFGGSNLGILFGGEVDPSDRGHEGAGGFANDVVLLDGNNDCAIVQQLTSSGTHEPWPEARGWSDGECIQKKDGSKCLYFFGGLAGDDSTPKRLDDLWLCQIKDT